MGTLLPWVKGKEVRISGHVELFKVGTRVRERSVFDEVGDQVIH